MKTSPPIAIILGWSGLLGATLRDHLLNKGYSVATCGRSSDSEYVVDVQNCRLMVDIINKIGPDYIINLIAETNVDACESDLKMALTSNSLIPAVVSLAITNSNYPNLHLIHVSTDQVYSGCGNNDEPNPNPINVYGITKLLGEGLIKNNRATIIRTNFYGRSNLPNRKSFSDWLFSSLECKSEITLFGDVFFSALNKDTLANYIEMMMRSGIVGTYNVGTKNCISKADFGIFFAGALDKSTSHIKVGKSTDFPFKAKRPLNMQLNVSRFESALGLSCPDIHEEISKTALEYKNV